MNLENMLNNKIKDLKPSGIRRFFDMASEYKDIVSLGVGELILIRLGIFVKKRLKRCKKAVHSIQLMQG